jgi:hypothetical protein
MSGDLRQRLAVPIPKRLRQATFLDDWLITPGLRERVLTMIGNCEPAANGCLLWLGKTIPKGYGQVGIMARQAGLRLRASPCVGTGKQPSSTSG